MAIVPITTAKRAGRGGAMIPATPPAEPFALMAAAQMHSEGRLIDTTSIPLKEDSRREQTVDDYIAKNKLKEGEEFQVQRPDGTKTYQYLGPNSGGRKDWMEISPKNAAPIS